MSAKQLPTYISSRRPLRIYGNAPDLKRSQIQYTERISDTHIPLALSTELSGKDFYDSMIAFHGV